MGAGVAWQDLLATLNATIASDDSLKIVKDIRLFDVWRDKSQAQPETSLAMRFWLQDQEVTLDDTQVEQCLARLLEALVNAHGVRQRA